MRLSTADLWSPPPGRVLRWTLTASGAGAPARLSLNQRNHLALAATGEATVWLAAAFDVDGPIDSAVLERCWCTLVARHGSLQLEALDPLSAVRHDPGTLRWQRAEPVETASAEETRALLERLLHEGCHPFGYPAFVPLAISRAERSTIVLGMDHLHCDAYSTTVVVDELARLYAAAREGRDDPQLPAAACFVGSVAAELDDPVSVAHDDERLRAWQEFARSLDYALPTFPLDLGVAPGERLPQASRLAELASAATMAGVSTAARAAGSSTYAVVLAALAQALHDVGGPARLDTLTPVQTRADAAAGRSIGWYTTTVPVSVDADLTPSGLAAAGEAVRRGVRLGAVPLDQVVAALPEPLRSRRRDVFMVSWIDYRHLPGGEQARARNAHHISAATMADDLQLWLARTEDGLAVRVRHPGTPVAREVVEALLEAWRTRLAEIAVRAPVRT